MLDSRVHFGPFTYDSEQRALYRGDQPVPLAPKTLDLLHVLLEERGRIVEKADLMRRVWPETTVEDVGLARNVSLLRKALGDEADDASFIETVPRRGYRFVADVLHDVPPAPMPEPPARRSRRPFLILITVSAALLVGGLVVHSQFYAGGPYLPRGSGVYASVAVVPFEWIGAPGTEAGLSRGLEEALAAQLAKLERVYVTSPGTVHRYHDKGVPVAFMSRVLRLDALVEGTIQHVGDRIRITARMADVRSGKLIWADSYELEPDTAQTEAATRIRHGVTSYLQRHQAHP
ncbi:MAG TPA: winged helix-turn-helix domain-containing protein [Bryobacteraceae bacterium]|nr:winged helix-turn-helix domain-containing protein [Bryobacteraceae bacterium]